MVEHAAEYPNFLIRRLELKFIVLSDGLTITPSLAFSKGTMYWISQKTQPQSSIVLTNKTC
jgi:hypothetical protein